MFVYKAALTANARRLPMLAVERLTIAILVCIYVLVSSEADSPGSEIVILALVGGVSVAVSRLLLLTAMRLGPAGLS
mgnify:FL=1